MRFKVTFSENGRVMIQTFSKPDASEQDVINWFGLEEPDIDWYKIEKIGLKS